MYLKRKITFLASISKKEKKNETEKRVVIEYVIKYVKIQQKTATKPKISNT